MSNRIEYIDMLKGVAIICVVMGHVVEKGMNLTQTPFNAFYWSFHMPLFMFLSGIFSMKEFCNNNFAECRVFLKKKLLRIMMPFFVVGGAYSLLLDGLKGVSISSFRDYWFLPALMMAMVTEMIVNVLYNRVIKFKHVFLDIALHLTVYLIMVRFWYWKPIIPYFRNFLELYPFFFLGVFFSRYDKIKSLLLNSNTFFSINIMLYLCYMFCFYGTFEQDIKIKYSGFFAVPILLFLSNRYHNEYTKWLGGIGRYSLDIYVFHWFLIPSIIPLGVFWGTKYVNNDVIYNGNFCLILSFAMPIGIIISYVSILVSNFLRHSKLMSFLCFGLLNKK